MDVIHTNVLEVFIYLLEVSFDMVKRQGPAKDQGQGPEQEFSSSIS